MKIKTFMDKIGITYLINKINELFVHKTNVETINNTKYFVVDSIAQDMNNSGVQLIANDPEITRYGLPSTDRFLNMCYWSSEAKNTIITTENFRNYLLGCIEYGTRSNGGNDIKFLCTKNDNTSYNYSTLVVGFDSNGIAFAKCPSTSDIRTTGNDIVTRDWIPKDTRIVRNGVTEEVTGWKTFTYDMTIRNGTPNLHLEEEGITSTSTAPSANKKANVHLVAHDGSQTGIAGITFHFNTDKSSHVHLNADNFTGSSKVSRSLHFVTDSTNTRFVPYNSNTYLLGTSGYKWKEIWCGQSSINSSSDERLKQQIKFVPDEILDAWSDVNWIQYKFNDAVEDRGDEARIHSGLIAQQIDNIFKNHNLDARDYGFFLYDKWNEEPEERDENGNITKEAVPAGNEYGLRYIECLAIEAAYQRRRADKLEARLAAIEAKLGIN